MRRIGQGRSLHVVSARETLTRSIAAFLAAISSVVLFGALTVPAASAACPNEAFRTGASAALPNCRAYELVTPANLNGFPEDGTGAGAESLKFSSPPVTPDGNSYLWTVFATGLPGTGSSGYGNLYQAQRTSAGWSSSLLSPKAFEAEGSNPGSASRDQQYVSVEVEGFRGGSLAFCPSCAITYVRYPDGTFHLLGEGTVPTASDSDGFDNGFVDDPHVSVSWIAPGGAHQIFGSTVQLTPDAPSGFSAQVYDRTPAGLELVSLLPGDVSPTASSTFAGSSVDGGIVLFKSGGNLYARLDNAKTLEVASGSAFTPGASITCSTTTAGATNTFQWLRNGSPIPGATSATYTTGAADEGKVLQCQITSTNAEGASRKASAPVTVAPAPATSPPAPGVPSTSGTANVGQTLTCSTGSWSGSPIPNFQWLRNGTPIPGATASTYLLEPADKGTSVQCEVTGTNDGGTAVADSTGRLINALPPTASVNPSISGTVAIGETLTCNPGTWANSPSFSYEWLRNGAPIAGATSQTYVVAIADEGRPVQCRVTATNADAAAQAVSPAVVVPPPPGTAPPSLSVAGTVTGTPNVGNTLTCNTGTWSGSPSLALQWLRNGAQIPGATNSTYTLTAADKGKSIQCRVTATNAGGSVVATNASATNGSRYVNPKPPVASATVSTPAVTPGGVSEDGAYAFFVQGGNIFRYDIAGRSAATVSGSADATLVSVSPDGSHAFFVSPSQLIAGKGTAGALNLYAWSGLSLQFVAIVSSEDLSHPNFPASGLDYWTPDIEARPAAFNANRLLNTTQTTPNGRVVVFESYERLTAYPSEGRLEIYRYDTVSGDLSCVSCGMASAASADSELVHVPTEFGIARVYPMNEIANLSDDGERVVFESLDALLPQDVNGARDVYQWDSGQLSLISTGQSPQPSGLFAVTPSGSDVFFTTGEKLVGQGQDPGRFAVYDARIGGGLASQQATESPHCVGEACQGEPASQPQLVTPGSAIARDKGNLKPRCLRHRKGRRAHKSSKRRHGKACRHARRRANHAPRRAHK